jgi:hypothetical protein
MKKQDKLKWRDGRYRKIVEAFIGRKLLKTEYIHHKDKDWNNNDISNLQIISASEHTKLHNKIDGNHFQGKHHTEEFKKQQSINMKGKYLGMKRPWRFKNEENRIRRSELQKLKTKEKSANWKGGMVELTCCICKKPFKVSPYRKNTAKFCSNKSCKSKYFSIKMKEIRNGKLYYN